MSIKGKRSELFVGKSEVNIFNFWGNKTNISYSDTKRIDYCFAERFKYGFMDFISKDNVIKRFEFGTRSNEPMQRAVDFIQGQCPSMYLRKCEIDESEKDRSVCIVPIFWQKELGVPSGALTLHQTSNGEVYLNDDKRIFYSIIDYVWTGPEFRTIRSRTDIGKSSFKTNANTTEVKKGKAGAVGAFVSPIGVSAARFSQTGNTASTSSGFGDTLSNSSEVSASIENETNATITLKRIDDKKTFQIAFRCNRDIDARIRCFDFERQENKTEAVFDAKNSLDGIKALKELLDIGAITQEEFDKKKSLILNI